MVFTYAHMADYLQNNGVIMRKSGPHRMELELQPRTDPVVGILHSGGAKGVLYLREEKWEVFPEYKNTEAGRQLRNLILHKLPDGWDEVGRVELGAHCNHLSLQLAGASSS